MSDAQRFVIDARAFVRGVLVDVFGQRATEAEIAAVAERVVAATCPHGLATPEKTTAAPASPAQEATPPRPTCTLREVAQEVYDSELPWPGGTSALVSKPALERLAAELRRVALLPSDSPPRWYGCEHRIDNEFCPDCAAPTPEATAPRMESYANRPYPFSDSAAAPARVASTAPGEPDLHDTGWACHPADPAWPTDLCARCGAQRSAAKHSAALFGIRGCHEFQSIEEADYIASLRATVVALTAEQGEERTAYFAGFHEGHALGKWEPALSDEDVHATALRKADEYFAPAARGATGATTPQEPER